MLLKSPKFSSVAYLSSVEDEEEEDGHACSGNRMFLILKKAELYLDKKQAFGRRTLKQ